MKDEGKKQITITDPESRAMKNNGKIDVAYNMQSSVDNKNKLIVTLNVVNDVNDQSQLFHMVSETNNILLRNEDRVILADTGYYNAKEIKDCLDDGNNLYLKPQKVYLMMQLIQKIIFTIKKKQTLILSFISNIYEG